MKLSIALCTYNGAPFLDEQLNSIAAQTRLPDELIVCDDGSTDGSLEQVRAFAAKATFAVHWHLNERTLGSNKNFQKAIELCQGDIIVLCDQDDRWREDKLARLEQTFALHPHAGCVFSDAVVTDEAGNRYPDLLWKVVGVSASLRRGFARRAFQILLTHTLVTGATMAFRSSYKPLVLPIDNGGPLIHDAWIATLLAAVSDVVPLPEPLIFYRRHKGQQTHEAGQGSRIRSLDYYRAHLRQLRAMRQRLATAGQAFDNGKLASKLRTLDAKVDHLQARLTLPGARARRLAPVLRELVAGRYHHYSNGWRSAARDLLI